jgi:RHS repeat-associated protein
MVDRAKYDMNKHKPETIGGVMAPYGFSTTAGVFVQSDQQTIADYTGGTASSSPTYTYVYASDIDEPVMRGGSGGLGYYHRTQQYSITALTNGGDLVEEYYAYDAYGLPINFDAAAAFTNLLYSGEQFDQRIAMQYLRARYYDPASGTFNRLDPFAGNIQDPQSLHKYLYVHGDPIQGIDPTGLITMNNVMASLSGIGRIGATLGRVSARVLRRVKFTAMGLTLGPYISKAMEAIGHTQFAKGEGFLIGGQIGAAMDIAASPKRIWEAFLGGILSATIEFFFQAALVVTGRFVPFPNAVGESLHAFAEGAFDTALSSRLEPWNLTGGPMNQALPQLKPMIGFFGMFWPLARGGYREQVQGNQGATPAHFFESLLFAAELSGVSSLAKIAPVKRRAVRIIESGIVKDLLLIASQTTRREVAERIWDVASGWMSAAGERLMQEGLDSLND